jgi:hypothetical protein
VEDFQSEEERRVTLRSEARISVNVGKIVELGFEARPVATVDFAGQARLTSEALSTFGAPDIFSKNICRNGHTLSDPRKARAA